MTMITIPSDKIRKDYRVYLEPVLAVACAHQAKIIGIRTMSRYIRRAIVLTLKADGFPVDSITSKFKKVKVLNKGVSPYD